MVGIFKIKKDERIKKKQVMNNTVSQRINDYSKERFN